MQQEAARARFDLQSEPATSNQAPEKHSLTRKSRIALDGIICLLLLVAAVKFVGEDLLLRPQKKPGLSAGLLLH